MSNGTKIALIVLAVLSLACFAGVWSMYGNANVALERAKADSVSAANEILVLFAGGWDPRLIELRTAADFELKAGDLEGWRQRFGPLIGGDMKVTDFQIGSALLTAKLECRAEFEKGKGDVTMTLTREPKNA